MIKDIKHINIPEYAHIVSATVTTQDMGESTITAQVRIDGNIRPDFSFDWEVEFKGERYIHPLRKPQATKENTSLSSTIDLTFKHWAIHELQRYFFVEMTSVESGTPIVDKYIASMGLTLDNFVIAFNRVLNYYYGGRITAELNPAWSFSEEPTFVSISYSYIWDVLIKMYDTYGVRWTLETSGDKCVIKFGYDATELDHVFEYGFDGGLLKVERQVQSDNIRNILLGRGGDRNLPYRYFKNTDPDNPSFPADPDWIPELKDMYFSELRESAFRSYVQGWKAKHYGGTVTKEQASVDWAWERGYTDAKFSPVEFVKDDSSIDKYGELWGGLENNQDIYPTIQGITRGNLGRIDQVVAVEKIESDDVEDAVEVEAKLSKVEPVGCTFTSYIRETMIAAAHFGYFTVDAGMKANLGGGRVDFVAYKDYYSGVYGNTQIDCSKNFIISVKEYRVYPKGTTNFSTWRSPVDIPAGDWMFEVIFEYEHTEDETAVVTASLVEAELMQSTVSGDNEKKWLNTFDIWVKNIWDTTKLSTESDEEYVKRVWTPILGNHLGEEAKVVFSSGWLSLSEDYEFTMISPLEKSIHYDTSKTHDGVQSHWRLTLAKSDADLDTLGVYLPNTKTNASAGDLFFFIGIDLPYMYYTEAEKRLTLYKQDALKEVSDIKPTWVVTLDKVRIANKQPNEVETLLSQLKAGSSLPLADKRFIKEEGVAYEKLYLQSVTYTYNEPTQGSPNLIPDVEVVLSDKYQVAANPVEQIQGKIDTLSQNFVGVSQIEQLVRRVGDKLYLRKDGFADRSYSPTAFASLLTSLGFRQGMLGGAGWGFFKDENGKWVMETDRLNVRDEMQVNTLVINQITARGGMIVESSASIEVTQVVETSDGYVCYFDQKFGTVGNLFVVNDIAFSQRFTTENANLKMYKRRVVAVDENSITITKGYSGVNIGDEENPILDTGVYGSGVPQEGDVIVQYGNYKDKNRQFVIVRDVIGGGYERMISGLDWVGATGNEYFYAGYQSSTGERLFIGNKEAKNWMEYKDGKLTIAGRVSILSEIENSDGTTTPIEEYLNNIIKGIFGENEDIKDFVDQILGDKLEDIQKQIDGQIETWFIDYDPTLENKPAIDWETEEDREKHSGDLCYNNKTGAAFRFSKDSDGNWFWNPITDEAITAALAAAAKAQDTADGKRRVFVVQPKPPYETGDLWVNATYGEKYHDDLLRCVKSKKEDDEFDIEDWVFASEYRALSQEALDAANDAKEAADNASKEAEDANNAVNNLKDYVDGAFADGIIDDMEKVALEKYINTLKVEMAEAKAAYESLYANPFLSGSAKTELYTAWEELESSINNVIYEIETAIADGIGEDWEKKRIDDAFAVYAEKYSKFTIAVEKANQYIQEYLFNISDEALKAATEAAKKAEDAQKEVNDVKNIIDKFWDDVRGAFVDGIIDDNEWAAIKAYINTIEKEKAEADAAYNALMANVFLQDGEEKTALKNSKEALDTAITKLLEEIEKAVKDRKVTDEESQSVDDAFEAFSKTYAAFTTAIGNAQKAMQDYIKSFADKAKEVADEAKNAADEAKQRLNEWADDGVISPTEKQGIKDEIARIDSDYDLINDGAELYNLKSNDTIKQYNSAYSSYRSILEPLTDTSKENIPIPSGFDTTQENYYNKRTEALSLITKSAKKDYDDKIAGYDYLKEALKGSTTWSGGLVLTSLIQLLKPNTTEVWSGISGVLDTTKYGYGIAAWYGGDMIDKEHPLSGENVNRAANSLFRFDGSGYLAGGNISWNTDGSGQLAGGNIHWDTTGSMTFGSGITLNVSNVSGLQDTLNSIANFMNNLSNWLTPVDKNYNAISWEKAFDSDDFFAIRANKGFYSSEWISALGANTSTGGGGGGDGGASYLYDLLDVADSVANPSDKQVLTYSSSLRKWVAQTIQTGGLDTAQLASYLTQNGYLTNATADNTYVKKSGDTMTGILHTPHLFEVYNGSATSKQSSYIKFTRNGVNGDDYVAIGYNGTNFRMCATGGDANYTSENDILLIGNNKQLKLQAPNGIAPITTSSTTLVANLNADLLDGLHSTSFFRILGSMVSNIDFADSNNNNGIYYWNVGNGGSKFPFQNGAVLNLSHTAFSGQIAFEGDSKYNIMYRTQWWNNGGGSWGNWKQIAFTDSTVAKANQLATARTLWGQSFDGSGNVSGNMTNVGSISASGAITTTSSLNAGSLELSSATPYIDFHFNRSTADLTSRIIEYASGELTLQYGIRIGYSTAPLIEWDADNKAYKINGNIYATGWISALGANASASGGGGGGVSYLSELLDTTINAPQSGQALIYNGSRWVNQTIQAGGNYLPLSGGTITGNLTVSGSTYLANVVASNAVNAAKFNATGSGATGGYCLNTNHATADQFIGYNSSTDTLIVGLVNSKLQLRAGATVDGALIATQSWVQSQGYLTGVGSVMTLNTDQNIASKKTWNASQQAEVADGNTKVAVSMKGIDFTFREQFSVTGGGGETTVKLASTSAGTLAIGNDIIATRNWVTSQGYISSLALGGLSNVTISSPTSGQVLQYNGSQWVNASVSSGGGGDADLSGYVKRSGDTMTGVLNLVGMTTTSSSLVTNLNADLLDGKHDGELTAAKLATPRTLWGQSFDGSANVSGNMTGVGSIYFGGNSEGKMVMYASGLDGWSDGTNSHPWYGYDARFHNTGVYSTTISNYFGLTLKTASGNISMTDGGNVGIGTTSPSYKLHVNGSMYAQNGITLGNQSATLSSVGWYTVYTGTNTNNYGNSVILHINRTYGNTNNESYTVAVNVAYDGKVGYSVLSSAVNEQLITKIRVVYVNAGSLVIQIYYNSTSSNAVSISGEGFGTFQAPSYNSSPSGSSYEFALNTSSSSEGYYKFIIDASLLDNNRWYPVTMAIGNSLQTRIRVEGRTSANASWNTRSDKLMALILDWTVNGSGYGWTTVNRVVHRYVEGVGANNCLAGIGQLENSSTEYVYVRGGAIYDFYVSRNNVVPTLRTSTYTISSQSVAPTTTRPDDINKLGSLVVGNNVVAINKKLKWMAGDAAMTIFPVDADTVSYGQEKVAIQTVFDVYSQDPETSTYPSTYPNRAMLLLQPRGGNIAIGQTASSSYKLCVNGACAASSFPNTSDIRLKNIVRDITIPVIDIAQAPSVGFTWKSNGELSAGSVAQYWKNILPEVVTADNDGILSMQYGNLALIATISVARKVVNHEERIAALEKENKELREQIEFLAS